ncbi:olfactory receptor 52Z1-like [Colossoma macropomum]|uniref:olfactory receptor 52Z1-like n=1 Tax=Colossoma macropomum TaxID=42526 RepID=UPI001864AB00|nr:olfactory receptor 52Z1-like [Colossoma macropomum]
MESNFSRYTTYLTLETLDIHTSNTLPAFIFGTLTYCAVLVCNMTVLLTIALNRKLHKPMYVLLFNLPINDMLGATAFFPQLVSSILSQNRSITYSACFVQALLVHLYGTGAFLILSAMAYDRYVAICYPLKYNTLMSPKNLMKMIIIMWTLHFIMIGFLLGVNYRTEICSTKIVDIFCNNPSLMKLVCGDTNANNYYGLFIMTFYDGLSLLIVAFTYIQILITVVVKRQSDAKSKALQTCGTHLIVFLCYEFGACFALIAHRIDSAPSHLRRALGASVMIFPPILNPLIYGLRTKEIRQNIIFFYRKKVFPSKQATKVSRGKRQLH